MIYSVNHEQSSTATGQTCQGNPEDIDGGPAGATPTTTQEGQTEQVALLTSEERHEFLRRIARSCASIGTPRETEDEFLISEYRKIGLLIE